MDDVRLIDARELVERLRDIRYYPMNFDRIFDLIYDSPTINPEDLRPHGKWELDGKKHCHCTVCGFVRNIESQIGWDYCNGCGARMDGE